MLTLISAPRWKNRDSKKFMAQSPCRNLEKNPRCIEYCNWHEKTFKEWKKDEFLTVMRYALPQRKMILDAIATAIASENYGQIVRRTTVNPFPSKSSSIPPRIRMIERHTILIQLAVTSG